eukprot:1207711-Pyramimonas_sp.AAC.1
MCVFVGGLGSTFGPGDLPGVTGSLWGLVRDGQGGTMDEGRGMDGGAGGRCGKGRSKRYEAGS